MISYDTHTFDNGLILVHHRDKGSRFAVVNILYKTGARNDPSQHTGLAHLMEHLMFGGTDAVPDFDTILQNAGGQSNAWTSSDITNYYDVIPLHNLDTALWLEADRMKGISFSQTSLEVQRKVVCEEFKETVFNAPYGDLFHIMAKNSYNTHPYRTPVIGDNLHDIETVTSADVKDFFYTNYQPANAILSVVADISFEELKSKVDTFFGVIKNLTTHTTHDTHISPDTQSTAHEPIRVKRDVPEDVIFIGYHMDGRLGPDYIATDIITDLLSTGQSSRFMENVILKGNAFRSLSSSVWGTLDPGLLFIRGSLIDGVSYNTGMSVINAELSKLVSDSVTDFELEKTINKAESMSRLENTNQEDLAYNLAYFTLLGNTSMIDNEYDKYRELTPAAISHTASNLFVNSQPTVIFYGPNA